VTSPINHLLKFVKCVGITQGVEPKQGRVFEDPYSRNLKTVSSRWYHKGRDREPFRELQNNILSTIGSQLDTLKIKKKQEEENATMCIFFPRCRRKHSSREFPLDNISVCGFCTEDHPTEKFPSLPEFVSHLQKWGSWGILLCT
jgi:hypothetical protein